MYGINKTKIEHIYDSSRYLDQIKPTLSNSFIRVFPFKIIGGAMAATETGYKGLNCIYNNYSQLGLLFTGKENVVTEWRDSVKNVQITDATDPKNPDKNFLRKYKNVGKNFKGRILSSVIQQEISVYAPQQSEQELVVARTFEVIFERNPRNNSDPNNDIISNFTTYEFDFFACPEIAIQTTPNDENIYPISGNIANSTLNYDHQLYRPLETRYYYDSKKSIIAVIIRFVSVNDFMANTGLAIQQFVRFGGAGQGYAFPTIASDGSITVDSQYIKNIPITHAQFQADGVVLSNSFSFIGYKSIEGDDNTLGHYEDVKTPSDIYFSDNFQAAIYDNSKFSSIAEQHYYALQGAIPNIDTYLKDWTQLIAANLYDPFMKKNREGDIIYNDTATTNTNIADKTTNTLSPYWSTVFLNGLKKDWTKQKTMPLNNVYLRSYDGDKQKYFGLDPNEIATKYNNIEVGNLSNYFYRNSLAYSSIQQLPVNVRFSVPISTNINIGGIAGAASGALGGVAGLFGFFTNFLNVSIPIGTRLWLDGVDNSSPTEYDFLISCSILDLVSKTTYVSTPPTGSKVMPVDFLRKGTDDETLILGGINSTTTAFAGMISNTVMMDQFDSNNARATDKVAKETYWVGQSDSSGNRFFHALDGTVVQKPQDDGYVIMGFKAKTLGKTSFRLTYFSAQNTDPLTFELDDFYSVWNGYYNTRAKMINNMWMIDTTVLHCNPFADIDKPFQFPEVLRTKSDVYKKSDKYFGLDINVSNPYNVETKPYGNPDNQSLTQFFTNYSGDVTKNLEIDLSQSATGLNPADIQQITITPPILDIVGFLNLRRDKFNNVLFPLSNPFDSVQRNILADSLLPIVLTTSKPQQGFVYTIPMTYENNTMQLAYIDNDNPDGLTNILVSIGFNWDVANQKLKYFIKYEDKDDEAGLKMGFISRYTYEYTNPTTGQPDITNGFIDEVGNPYNYIIQSNNTTTANAVNVQYNLTT